MIKLIKIFGVITLLVSTNTALAGTVIRIQNNGDMTTVMTDGKLARLSMSGDENEYIIIDYRKQTVNVVSPQKHQVMQLNAGQMAAGAQGPQVRTAMKELGSGVKVAGYPTRKYSFSANGKSCGVIYGSREVYQKEGIKELFQAMRTMMERQRAILGGLAGMVDDCTLADMKISDHVKAVGVPMRSERDGRVETEIKSIKYGVTLPADTFVIPASYKVLTMQQQINAAKKNMMNAQQRTRQHNTQPPQMQDMMRQLQQSGQLTPEMMQQMRRSQGMMQQYQQQR